MVKWAHPPLSTYRLQTFGAISVLFYFDKTVFLSIVSVFFLYLSLGIYKPLNFKHGLCH